ncbi:MAG: Ppx/GppA family phosphatase [Alphaproteobacteria bacterium]|nr:Ppx/GppA family phosphatase [Alphaproteobacteria bacterium]
MSRGGGKSGTDGEETVSPRRSCATDPPRWQEGPVFAALDLGTNNCRLLLARPVRKEGPTGFRVIDAFSRIVRLGERHDDIGSLSPEAVDRAMAALKVCANKMSRRTVIASRLVATEACRRAPDGADFIARVAEETGLSLEIISAEEEARLALTGCAPLFDRHRPYALVFDIGGGSTEVSWLRLGRQGHQSLLATHSIPVGVVGLAEAFGGVEVTPETYRKMVDETLFALRDFDGDGEIGHELRRGRVQVLGTSGTVTTLAGIKLDLPRYDRSRVDGCFLSRRTANQVTERLINMSYAARASHPCIGRDRADLVLAGCAILEAILRRWPAERLRVADRGLREGIILQLIRSWRDERTPQAAAQAAVGGEGAPVLHGRTDGDRRQRVGTSPISHMD